MSDRAYKKFEIKSCRSCSSKNLRLILDLGPLYLSDFTKGKRPKIKKYPLTLVVCKKCSLVQLLHTTPPKELYTDRYGYRSGISNTMRQELSEIVKKGIKVTKLKKGDVVIDIGANDGTLLSFYPKGILRIAVEPVKKFAKDSRKFSDKVVSDFFTRKAVMKAIRKNQKAKVITAISMFYDLDDPNTFLKDVKSLLKDDGVFIIQQNYLVGMLKLNAFDNIVHEHLEYYSLKSLENLLIRNDLRVFDVEETSINGGSFRTYACLISSSFKETPRVKKMREKEERLKLNDSKTYDDFAKRVKDLKKKIRSYIEEESKAGRSTYIYGASTRGNTLIQYCQLNNRLIPKAVERNPEKWGKYIASMGTPIISEEKGRRELPDNMLVLPWFFQKEILTREKDYIKGGGRLIFPLPSFEVVKKSLPAGRQG